MSMILVILFAGLGLFISIYIYINKKRKNKMHCFFGMNCNKVLYSKFGKTFGIENSILGILYYIFISLVAIIELLSPGFISSSEISTLITFTAMSAVLASIYLLILQLYILKNRCEYCITSFLVNILVLFFLIF